MRATRKSYFIYITSSRSRNLYVGCTSALERRVAQHRAGWFGGHTAKYRIRRLVYSEPAPTARAMVVRERQIKTWTREKRVGLIEAMNPGWDDLAASWALPVLPTRRPWAP